MNRVGFVGIGCGMSSIGLPWFVVMFLHAVCWALWEKSKGKRGSSTHFF